MLNLLAEDSVSNALAGSGGWAGAGLLGLVLGWLLLRHLPAKDVQLEKLVKDKDVAAEKLIDTFLREVKESHSDLALERKLRNETESRLASLLEANTYELRRLTSELDKLMRTVADAAQSAGRKNQP